MVQDRTETGIREVIAERLAAMRARDADRVIAAYAPETVVFDLAPPLRHTGAEVLDAEALKAWFATFDDTFDVEIRDLSVSAGEDVAFCHGLHRMGTAPDAPERFDLWFRATYGLRRVDGAWRITHVHESTPFYMDGSFKAATDLTP